MKNLIRNVWVCLGLMMLPFTASGQQKDNITYVPAQELLLVGKATTEGEFFHRVDTAKYRTMPPTVKKCSQTLPVWLSLLQRIAPS